ncbi:hypothetical protein VKT23_008157 [Stygiomarasmius scandens]|uniref:Uncharacterized protein n=1 Tax=Marasmiellus scandens TaxID=2682957 RepID=A0ABR1JK86_9AGAR
MNSVFLLITIKSETTQNRVFSASTAGSSSASTNSTNFALPFNADVPIYDARATTAFNVFEDLARIDTILPRLNSDIPPQSLAVVASTITTIPNSRGPRLKVNFNIRFAILLGIPKLPPPTPTA